MSPQSISPGRLDKLIAEHKLLRILTPELKRRIKQFYQHSPWVVEVDNQLYLSLGQIADQKQRAYFYQLIQCYQAGQEVDLATLPGELQQLLHPDRIPPPLFWGSFIVGGIVGLIVGVTTMAIGMLFVNVTAVTSGDPNQVFNLQTPIVIFVFSGAISWILTSVIAWRYWKKPVVTNKLTD